MKNIVQMIEVSKNDLILDFGCGKKQHLKSYLPGYKIIGYDIKKEYSDISDYRPLKPHTIVCSHVLEHLEKEQLLKISEDFKKMRPKFIITAQPTENLLSKICNLIGRPTYLGKDFRVKDHILRITDIHKMLSGSFQLKSRRNILTLTLISKWDE